ncbi:MAG: TolC family protein [Calditrichaceae bacterium]|nr:TolC family protein [Calditrichaceae bacterium]MBN2708976.1 TolC family protein [Calditrichaceae bacterium]RQV93352.1 MAG: TolC family protein [Calditrichota bacterium]
MKKLIILTLTLFISFLNASEWLSVEDCIELAFKNNLNILKNSFYQRQSEIQVNQSWSALYPSLSANASTSNSGPLVSEPANSMNWSINGSLNQSIYRPGMYTGIKLAGERLVASEFSNKTLENEIRASVEKLYFKILASDTLIGVYQANILLSDEQIAKMEQLVELGIRRKSDLLKANVQRGTFQSQLVRERESLASAKRALNILMGREPDIEFNLQHMAVDQISVPDFQAAVDRMIENNPEIKRLKSLIAQQEISLTISKEAYLPSIYGSYSYSRSNAPAGMGNYIENDRVSLNLSIDIFDGFKKSQNIEINQLNLSEAQVNYDARMRELTESLLNQYNTLETQNNLIEIHQTNLVSAREDLAVVSEHYANGLSTVLDLTDAQVAVLESETNLLRDLYTRKQIEAEIQKLLGSL